MTLFRLRSRAHGLYLRSGARFFFRRPFVVRTQTPIISFTFDDFPRSALWKGGNILQRFGLVGTYYASFGLMGKEGCNGPMFLAEDLRALLEQGHELGCHTFGHCHSGETKSKIFSDSIIENARALRRFCPETSFRTFSYPISAPRVWTKHKVNRYFECCRGGGQTFNVGTTDLNYLRAYFLEKDKENPAAVKRLIDQNRNAGGWLIFATHDISETPSPFGCTPDFLEDIAQYSVNSGATILPVAQALEVLRASSSS
jgi:peptidoglycan/xylan/chitin deacetylase (PgdA/CDA1 family)